MGKFQVGDRVRVVSTSYKEEGHTEGNLGEVVAVLRDGEYEVKTDLGERVPLLSGGLGWHYYEQELELVLRAEYLDEPTDVGC
jgi:hypothetical protein